MGWFHTRTERAAAKRAARHADEVTNTEETGAALSPTPSHTPRPNPEQTEQDHHVNPQLATRERNVLDHGEHGIHPPIEPKHAPELSDAQLIANVRRGQTHHYATLWARHRAAAIYTAATIAPYDDVEDIVSESYSNILKTLQNGKGPEYAFRPYLTTVIRNSAIQTVNAKQRTNDDLAPYTEHPAPPAALSADNKTLLLSAFDELPEKWRQVLWLIEIEGMPPRDIAKELRTSANSVSIMASRARERLRERWYANHIDTSQLPEACQPFGQDYPSYLGGKLSRKRHSAILEHLEHCEHCPAVLAEAEHSARKLNAIIIPAGLFAGAEIARELGVGAVGAVALELGGAALGTGSGSGFSLAGLISAKLLTVLGTILVAVAGVAGIILSSSANPGEKTGSGEPAPDTAQQRIDETYPQRAITDPTDTRNTPNAQPSAPPTPAPPAEPVAPPAPAPVIGTIDTGNGRYLPQISGTAEPNATIMLNLNGQRSTTRANNTGNWAATISRGAVPGENSLTVQQQPVGSAAPGQATEPVRVWLEAPTASTNVVDGQMTVQARFEPGAHVLIWGTNDVYLHHLSDPQGTETVRLFGVPTEPDGSPAFRTSAAYVSPDGTRVGVTRLEG